MNFPQRRLKRPHSAWHDPRGADARIQEEGMHRVLITGAGGGIGRSLRETLRGVYPVLRLSDRVPLGSADTGEEVDCADLADTAAVERIVAGVDAINLLSGIR